TENDGRRGSTQVQRSSSVDGHVEMTESATLDKDSKGKKKVEEIRQVGKINDGMGGSTQVQG
ncbi:hypothetical protein A2U01_0085328, partial [Trifolium medium]|nr:hypothetical protein [Trifolium medium]